ncbi:DNA mismatch repair endonuclease MutL [Dialister micraerophilus]|uniref:DNA mismatch repair protein MutL n=1 Tax=Dialister micraerophilus UPII 345-E TaxID=910314 RepID=E4LAN7_9FIRM|nr:DNA mismatch repair endonuclease MutL [Dialister micraerophilus]EFR42229.1 DNA mismatch repair domain protein [Dialister micraerophilus UPII 345-E]
MALIHLLDEKTINQIAAGEVVERPVNAVKEMVENSVDANASEIEVEIADGGITYIRVTDNGSGMDKEDAEMSIIRHATSKISTVDNIFHISSLGFRGEALASIAAVSKFTLTTRQKDNSEGIQLDIESGKITDSKIVGAPVGTTIEVRELFYNVPARKKFLKTERTEAGRINTIISKMALSHPTIAFRLINNGRVVIETPGNGRLLDAVTSLYGIDVSNEMFTVEHSSDMYFLDGMISKPSLLKSSRQYQTIIVNHRIVESPLISKAIDNAYHSLLPKTGYPVCIIKLTVPPESIDINVHPQKREIKFEDEKEIFRLVYHAVLKTLTAQSEAAEIATEITYTPKHESVDEKDINIKKFENNYYSTKKGNDFVNLYWKDATDTYNNKTQENHYEKRNEYNPENDLKNIYSENSILENFQNNEKQSERLFEDIKKEELVIPLGQVANCFIICVKGKELFIIDQHAAHERVRYDKLAEHAESIPVQNILIPHLITMDKQDIELFEERRKDIERLGIIFEQAGIDVIRITGAPEDFSESDMERVIHDLLIAFNSQSEPSPETLRHRMMAYAACRGAIKAGDVLNIRQMKELISDLFMTSRPFVCPHGRPTIIKFTPEELGKLFKRT